MTTARDTVPKPIAPGAEMTALLRFHRDNTWTGTISAGGMDAAPSTETGRGA